MMCMSNSQDEDTMTSRVKDRACEPCERSCVRAV